MVQLRAEDIIQIEGIWCMRFDPDAGPLKTRGSKRPVPLHPAVTEGNFFDLASRISSGLLFSGLPPDKFGSRDCNGTKVLDR